MSTKQLEKLEKYLLDAIEKVKEPETAEDAKALALLTLAAVEVGKEWRAVR